ncbi:hypothetical protein [Shewanella sp. MBTL60-007]|uniref:hypothetical protein n=1 Tax=Shewanella sp. MBTL60-007 TaxID=2815911 RepID=UPI001BBBBF4B|nr:hypothetical protein [Shewanella sp. MBTL60-007]GIU22151.1 hypothetical protein TUM3792_23890 [Shewanella sp. MBTL60-007]
MNQLSDNNSIETSEEKEFFERLTKQQQVEKMAAIARTSKTQSAEGVCTALYEAGVCFPEM